MRVPIFQGNGRIEWEERAIPEPGAGELLIQMRANALCGTDRHQLHDGCAAIPGHEAAGIVAAAGAGVRASEGDEGLIYLMGYCGECRNCRAGHTNVCLAKGADIGFERDGGYAPYALVPERNFVPVKMGVHLADATLALEAMSCAAHAIERARAARGGIESLLVSGAGPIGLGAVAMGKLLLGQDAPIFAADMNPYRLELAERLGARTIDVSKRLLHEALADFGSPTVDAAIETSGRGAARQAALDVLIRRGALVCVGHGEWLTMDVSGHLIAPERSVLGSEYFLFGELERSIALFHEHRVYLSQIITHRFLVSEIDRAFQAFLGGQTGKVLVQH